MGDVLRVAYRVFLSLLLLLVYVVIGQVLFTEESLGNIAGLYMILWCMVAISLILGICEKTGYLAWVFDNDTWDLR